MKNLNIINYLLIALIVGAISFYGGLEYQKSKTPQFSNFRRNGSLPLASGRPEGRQAYGERPVTGQIINIGEGNITVKTQDGSSKIVLISDTTKINKTESADMSLLTEGLEITVIGTTNSDGSVSAGTVNLGTIN